MGELHAGVVVLDGGQVLNDGGQQLSVEFHDLKRKIMLRHIDKASLGLNMYQSPFTEGVLFCIDLSSPNQAAREVQFWACVPILPFIHEGCFNGGRELILMNFGRNLMFLVLVLLTLDSG